MILPTLMAVMLLATALPALPATQRLVLERGVQSGAHGLKGLTEISVVPPFAESIVTILLDGEKVATRRSAPYALELDFGPAAVEHTISVIAVSVDGKQKATWAELINRGNRPLTISLEQKDSELEAIVTAPADDPVVGVEFFDATTSLGRQTSPPYRIPLSAREGGFIYATARTASGAEFTDYLSDGLGQFDSYQVRTVPLYVSVVDERGNANSHLDRSKFRILDSGREARILEFGLAQMEPISVALVMDASASMMYQLELATKSAQQFVEKTMHENDRFSVFSVRSSPRREIPLTNDRTAVTGAISNVRPEGKTALFDAIAASVRELQNEKSRRAIVILSDGDDTSSIYSYEDMFHAVKQAGIPLYVIAFGQPAELETSTYLDRLKMLAGQTGGFATTADEGNLAQRYDEIERDLRSQYLIKYQVTDSAAPNQWRAVEVKLREPNLKARTIRGYFTR
ncbi:MAG: VWA domain-containing protein [Thermoanaerobaculia bacterium]